MHFDPGGTPIKFVPSVRPSASRGAERTFVIVILTGFTSNCSAIFILVTIGHTWRSQLEQPFSSIRASWMCIGLPIIWRGEQEKVWDTFQPAWTRCMFCCSYVIPLWKFILQLLLRTLNVLFVKVIELQLIEFLHLYFGCKAISCSMNWLKLRIVLWSVGWFDDF